MFGYITPLYNELKLRDYYYFKSYYCGLCHTIKKNFGNLPRLTLNYDLTFIGFLLDGLNSEPISSKKIHCLKHPATDTLICETTDALDYISKLNIILSDMKLKDNIEDEGSIKSRLFHILFTTANKKAQYNIKSLITIINKNMDLLSSYEKLKNFSSLDEVCNPFSEVMAHILQKYPSTFSDDCPEVRDSLYYLGYYMGKWIYLMDALDDWKDDLDNNRFNPLNTIYNPNNGPFNDIINLVIEDIDFVIFNCLNNCSEYIQTLPFKKHHSVIDNVINLGMPNSYYTVIFRIKELLNLKEASVT